MVWTLWQHLDVIKLYCETLSPCLRECLNTHNNLLMFEYTVENFEFNFNSEADQVAGNDSPVRPGSTSTVGLEAASL